LSFIKAFVTPFSSFSEKLLQIETAKEYSYLKDVMVKPLKGECK
jgi:hypothetical protein